MPSLSTFVVVHSFSWPYAQMEFASVGDVMLSSVTAQKGFLCFDLLTDPVMFRISKPTMLLFFFSFPGYHSKRQSSMNSD